MFTDVDPVKFFSLKHGFFCPVLQILLIYCILISMEMYALHRLQKIQEVMAQLEKRNTTLEEKFSELTQRLLQAQLNESELRDQLASSLPEAEKSSLEGTIAELSKAKAQLDIENSHLKEVAEVARQQAIAVEMIQTSHDLEMTSLRQQVFDLQGTSDEKAAMGRLHHQLLALQVSEATALKRVEVAQAKVSSELFIRN